MKNFVWCFFVCALLLPLFGGDERFVSNMWYGYPEDLAARELVGGGFGLPLFACGRFSGSAISFLGNDTGQTDGVMAAFIFNRAASLEGVQLALANIQEGQHGEFTLQAGIYNHAAVNGIQFGIINYGGGNASFQFGVVNVNRGGLLPVTLLVNFGRDFFSGEPERRRSAVR